MQYYAQYPRIEDFLNSYENALETKEEYRKQYLEYRKYAPEMLRAICAIFGFGMEQDWEKAKRYLISIDYQEIQYVDGDWDRDCLDYLLSLREAGCQIEDQFLRPIVDRQFFVNTSTNWVNILEATAGSTVRHLLSLVILSDHKKAAASLGDFVRVAQDKDGNKYRDYFYYDDQLALQVLSRVAEVNGFAFSTLYAIKIATDKNSSGFDYEFGKRLCRYAFQKDISHKELGDKDDSHNWMIRANAIDGMIRLGEFTEDQDERIRMGNEALEEWNKMNHIQPDYVNKKMVGLIYGELLLDYKKALMYLDEAQRDGYEVGNYISQYKCGERSKGKLKVQQEAEKGNPRVFTIFVIIAAVAFIVVCVLIFISKSRDEKTGDKKISTSNRVERAEDETEIHGVEEFNNETIDMDDTYMQYLKQIVDTAIESNEYYTASKQLTFENEYIQDEYTAYYEKYAIMDLDADGVDEMILLYEMFEGGYKWGEVDTGHYNGYFYTIFKKNDQGIEDIRYINILNENQLHNIHFYENGTFTQDDGSSYESINDNYFSLLGILPDGYELSTPNPRIALFEIDDDMYEMMTVNSVAIEDELGVVTEAEYEEIMKKMQADELTIEWHSFSEIK